MASFRTDVRVRGEGRSGHRGHTVDQFLLPVDICFCCIDRRRCTIHSLLGRIFVVWLGMGTRDLARYCAGEAQVSPFYLIGLGYHSFHTAVSCLLTSPIAAQRGHIAKLLWQ
jgi:hypothetical protein